MKWRVLIEPCLAAILLLGCVGSYPSYALDIILHYKNIEPPAHDPNGAHLTAIMQAAASVWEDIIHDQHTLDITFGWQEIGGGTAANLPTQRVVADRVTDVTIIFNPKISFFIDPTPLDHSEFDLVRRLYSSLNPTEMSDFFDGTPPEVFEVGFGGPATDPVTQGREDLFTTAMHEIGHALGVCACTNLAEQLDNDYDLDPNGAFGNVSPMAAPIAVKLVVLAGPHLADNFAVMKSGPATGGRILPSAADVAAMTATSRWVGIDLPRKSFLSGSDWHSNINWIGSRFPDIQDDVYISEHNATGRIDITLGQSADAANLTLVLNSELDTNGFGLFVANKTELTGTSLLDTSNGSMGTNDLIVNLGEVLTHSTLSANTVRILATGRLRGSGNLSVGSSFEMISGGIVEPEGGTLRLTSLQTQPVFNFGSGVINALNGSLVVHGVLTDAFAGFVDIGEGQSVTFAQGWQLADTGILSLHGGASPASLIGPNQLTTQRSEFLGRIDVEGTGIIDSVIAFRPPASIALRSSSDILVLDGPTTYGGDISAGDGMIRQKGNATAAVNTEITVGTYDWDGEESSPSSTTIPSGVNFTVSSDQIEQGDPSIDGYDGQVAVNGGLLKVNATNPWRLDGAMGLNNGAIVEGSEMVVHGNLTVNGANRISAPVVFQPTSNIAFFGTNTELDLAGPTTYRGGMFFGGFSTLTQTGTAVVDDDTTLHMRIYDWDGHPLSSQTTIHPGKTFTINADQIERGDPAADGHDGLITVNGGTLHVNTTAPWRIDGILELTNGATVNGSDILVHGSIESFGVDTIIAAVDVQPSGLIAVDSGARLQLARPMTYRGGEVGASGILEQRASAHVVANTLISGGVYDWDGLGVFPQNSTTIDRGITLTLDVDKIEDVPDPENDGVGGTINLNGGNLNVKTPGPWRLDGTLNLSTTSGSNPRVQGSELDNKGSVVVSGTAFMEAPYRIGHLSNTSMPAVSDTLHLNNGVIYDGGNVTGDGRLVQNSDAIATDVTDISVRTFDWDGSQIAPSTTTVDMRAGLARLEINADRIEVPRLFQTDGHDGVINLVRGRLIVNTPAPWRLDGTLNFAPSSQTLPTLEGADVIVQGRIETTGEAVIHCGVVFQPTATVNVDAGEIIHFNRSVTYRGGTFRGQGTLLHNVDATVEAATRIDVATLDLDGSNENGSLKVNTGQLMLNVGSLDSSDNVFDGAMRISDDLSINTPIPWINNGRLQLLSSGAINGAPLTSNGFIVGTGTIGVSLENHGEIIPGENHSGTLTINGTYRSSTSANLDIELGGSSPGSFDVLQINGDALLRGTLNVTLIGGFTPNVGDRFNIILADSITGSFSTVNLPTLPSGVGLRVLYDFQSVQLEAY